MLFLGGQMFYLAIRKYKLTCSSFGCCSASISMNRVFASNIICVVPPIKNVISILCASILIFLDKYFFKWRTWICGDVHNQGCSSSVNIFSFGSTFSWKRALLSCGLECCLLRWRRCCSSALYFCLCLFFPFSFPLLPLLPAFAFFFFLFWLPCSSSSWDGDDCCARRGGGGGFWFRSRFRFSSCCLICWCRSFEIFCVLIRLSFFILLSAFLS